MRQSWISLFRIFFIVFIVNCLVSSGGLAYAFDKSLDQGLDEIAQKVTKSIPAGAKKTVAVMDVYEMPASTVDADIRKI